MEALDSYYNTKIRIDNKQSIIDEIIYAFECFLAKKLILKQIYLIVLLSTSVIYSVFAVIYIIYGCYWTAFLNFLYILAFVAVIRLYFHSNFREISTLFVYITSQTYMILLIYNYGFSSGMWLFNVFMIYFSSAVALENVKLSRIILAIQFLILIFIYFLDIFVWNYNREINESLNNILYFVSFACCVCIFIFLSMIGSIDGFLNLERIDEKVQNAFKKSNKSMFNLALKKHFINNLGLMVNTHSKSSKTTHFCLVDFNNNINLKEDMQIKLDIHITQAIKMYFPDTSYISHWNQNQYMFVMFDKADDHIFSLMKIFLRDCKKKLQNSVFEEMHNIKYWCACATFGDIEKINLKQALYETENLLRLSKGYSNDSVFVANYMKKKNND